MPDALFVGSADREFLQKVVGLSHVLVRMVGGEHDPLHAAKFQQQIEECRRWKAVGMINQGYVLALTGKASNAVKMLASGITARRSTDQYCGCRCTCHIWREPMRNSDFDDAWRCIGEAMTAVETTKERWCEADIHVSPATSRCCRRSLTRQKRKGISSKRSPSRVSSKPSPGNCARNEHGAALAFSG